MSENNELTREERRKQLILDPQSEYYLAGMAPFDEDEPAIYVPRSLRGLSNPPTFEIVAYTRDQVREYFRVAKEGGDVEATILSLLKTAVKGWMGLTTRKGKPIQYSPEALDKLPMSVIADIHSECLAYATGILPEEALGLA